MTIIFYSGAVAIVFFVVAGVLNGMCKNYTNPIFDSGPQTARALASLIMVIAFVVFIFSVLWHFTMTKG